MQGGQSPDRLQLHVLSDTEALKSRFSLRMNKVASKNVVAY